MVRPYHLEDKWQVIELLELNTPRFFHPDEESDFITYLDKYADHYFVVELEGRIVGCGGYNYTDDRSMIRISWDMIHPDFHGKGIGTQLTLHRLNEIRKTSRVKLVEVRTSQLAYQFYEKVGFKLEKVEKDFWAKGFDLYQMQLRLD